MEQDDKFKFVRLPFERGEIPFSKGFLYMKTEHKYTVKL